MGERLLRIGDIAARAGVSVQTIRYYERRGLVPALPRLRSGHRAYPPTLVTWIRFIKIAQALGFSLKDVAELKALARAAPRDRQPAIRRRLAARLAEIDQRIVQLRGLRRALTEISNEALDGDPLALVETLERRLNRLSRSQTKKRG